MKLTITYVQYKNIACSKPFLILLCFLAYFSQMLLYMGIKTPLTSTGVRGHISAGKNRDGIMKLEQTKLNTAPLNDELPEKEAINWPIKILQRLKSSLGCKRIKHTASKLSHRWQFCRVRGQWGLDFVPSPDGMNWKTGIYSKLTEQELVISFTSDWHVIDYHWRIGNASDSRALLGPAPLPMISTGKVLISAHAKERTIIRGLNQFNDCFTGMIEGVILSSMRLRTPLNLGIHNEQNQWLVPLPNSTIAVVRHQEDADYLYVPTILHPLQAQLQRECVNPWAPTFANAISKGVRETTGVMSA